jgi:hypothetical protein
MIPMNDVVQVYKSGKTDSWGIATSSAEPIEFNGMVVYSSKLETLRTAEGKEIVVSGNIVFKGKADVESGDLITVEDGSDKKHEVLQVFPVNDLSAKTKFTKVIF